MVEEILDTDLPIPVVLTNFENYLDKSLKPSSVKAYMYVIKRYFKQGNEIDNAKHYVEFVYYYMTKRKLSHYYDVILKFVKWLNIDKYKKAEIKKAFNVVKKKYHDPVKKTDILNRTERIKIINSMNSYKHQIVGLIQEECGVRAGDVLRLERGSITYGVDGDENNVTLTMVIKFKQKGNKIRTVNIFNKDSILKIQDFIRNKFLHSKYYFLEDKYVRDKYDELNLLQRNYYLYWEDLHKTCEKLSYDPHKFTTHDIRRNFSTEMYNILDKDVVALQRVMGHVDINTTLRYLRYSGLQDKEAFRKRNNLNN